MVGMMLMDLMDDCKISHRVGRVVLEAGVQPLRSVLTDWAKGGLPEFTFAPQERFGPFSLV